MTSERMIKLPRRFDVLGVGISETNLAEACDVVAAWVEDDAREYVCVTNVHAVMECQDDSRLRMIQNSSGLTVPDGRPLVWCGRRLGSKKVGQVRGADLMLRIVERSAREGWKSYFLGGTPETSQRLADVLVHQFPGFNVAGIESPPFRELTPAEEQETIIRINESGADLVWVGLSAPKQEHWMAKNREALDAPVLFGVGAAFDFLSGGKRQAPRWMQKAGLEWAFRLGLEPKRMWRRYAVTNPAFLAGIIRRPPAWKHQGESIPRGRRSLD